MTKPSSILGKRGVFKYSSLRGLVKVAEDTDRMPIAPQQFERFLDQLKDIAGKDAQLWSMIENALKDNGLGFVNQNQPSGDHEDMEINVSDDNRGKMPNNPVGETDRNQSGSNPYQRLPNPKLEHPANVHAGWKDAERLIKLVDSESNIRRPVTKKKPIRSLFLTKQEEAPIYSKQIITKSYSCTTGVCEKSLLHFSLSDNALDRDGDYVLRETLEHWRDQIRTDGLPLNINHSHDVMEEIGVMRDAQVTCDNNNYCRLDVSAKLFENNKLAEEVLNQARQGRKLSFSMAAGPNDPNTVWGTKTEHGRAIHDMDLLHASVVATPANPRARLINFSEDN